MRAAVFSSSSAVAAEGSKLPYREEDAEPAMASSC